MNAESRSQEQSRESEIKPETREAAEDQVFRIREIILPVAYRTRSSMTDDDEDDATYGLSYVRSIIVSLTRCSRRCTRSYCAN
jgi:hypothetical protein